MKRSLLALSILVALLLLPTSLTAQTGDLPPVEPSACVIEPWEMVSPGDPGDLNLPTPTPKPIETDNAVPADEETATAVIERIAQSIACSNAGDLPRMIANFSSGWISARFSGYDLVFMQRFLEASETPQPVSESEHIELIAVENVLVREDGEALANVVTRQAGIEQRSLLALVLEDGAWAIDRGQIIVTD